MHRVGRDNTSVNGETARERLLRTKVADIIAAHPGALEILIRGGFAPLRNPVMRKALSHTVNLEQALRIRSLSEADEESVISALLERLDWEEK